MGKFRLGTFLFLVAFLAMMFVSYRCLPEFPRLKPGYSRWVLSGCWMCATVGSFIPVAVKQQFLSNRFWYVLVASSMIGTWSGFMLLDWWCCVESQRSVQFPGLGAILFLIIAASLAGLFSFVIGWFVPSHPRHRGRKQEEQRGQAQWCSALRLQLNRVCLNFDEGGGNWRVACRNSATSGGGVYHSAQQRTARHEGTRGGPTFWQLLIFQYAVLALPATPSLTYTGRSFHRSASSARGLCESKSTGTRCSRV